jgi:hypothetical protein
MKIVIEISGGIVAGVYADERDIPCDPMPQCYVVDLDGVKVGEATKAEECGVEPLSDASDLVIDAMEALK